MASIHSVTLEVSDHAAARTFYAAAFDLDGAVQLQESATATAGFRGFTLSLLVSQPADADALLGAALAAGATPLKPAAKSMWGYGGVVRAPDGTIWKVATSKKKDSGPATRAVEDVVLLLGVADVGASKRYYADLGFEVDKSIPRTYAQFHAPEGGVKLALYKRRALAKDAGVDPDGSGSHRVTIRGGAGALTDPDGFAWAPAPS